MLQICIGMLRIPFKFFEFAFECFVSLSNSFWMVRIRIRMPFEWFEFSFEYFKFLSNASNLHLNALNFSRIVQICIRMLRIPFEWFEIVFEGFECLSNCSNLHSNDSNPFHMIRIFIRMLWIPLEWFEFEFEWFECLSNCSILHSNASLSNGSNLQSNASNPFRIPLICIEMLLIPFEWLEFAFECI